MKHSILPTILLLLGVVAGSAWAREREADASEPEGAFGEVVDVNVVNVDVYVTDKKGNRIKGLGKDDFEIVEDKRPVKITNFYVVEDGAQVGDGAGKGEDTGAAPTLDDVALNRFQEITVPEEQRLYLVIYVDNFNLHPLTRNRTFGSIRAFLRQTITPNDRVMVVSYDRSLKQRHPFTRDIELINSVLFELEDVSGHAVQYDSERRDIMRSIYESQEIYEVRGRAVQYAESVYNDLLFTIDALKETVDSLAGLPGRKAILYVSDGLSMRAGEDVFYALDDHFQDSSVLIESHRYDASRRFAELTTRANANRVSFYTLEAAGLRAYSYMDASNSSPGGGARIDQIHFSNIQEPLHLMAQETGGLAITNTNNPLRRLGQVADDFKSYYSLGYTSGLGKLGRYKQIRVRVKGRKNLKVRHREGYRDKPIETRMAETTMAALNFGFHRNPLGIELEVEGGTARDDGHYMVPVKVRIPIGQLSFLPFDELHKSRLRLFVTAKDTDGGQSPVQEVPVGIEIPNDEIDYAREKQYEYQLNLLMRRGRQVVAVGVRDEVSAETSFLTRGVTIGGGP